MKKTESFITALEIFFLLTVVAGVLALAAAIALRSQHDLPREQEMLTEAQQVAQALHDVQDQEDLPAYFPQEAGADTEAESDAPASEEDAAEQDTALLKGAPHSRIIFVGDSRTVGMSHAESEERDQCIYIGESGEGYHWFADTGILEMSDAIRDYPDAPVVLNLGVNDTGSVRDYIALYRTFGEIWPDTDFYFLSVNPVTRESESVRNGSILLFNAIMQNEGPFPYLDSFTWLLVHGFESVDGVHYSWKTYCDIHDFAVSELNKKRAKPKMSSAAD